MSDLHLIWNPVAGNGLAAKTFTVVTRELESRGIPYTSAKSAYPGHAMELAKESAARGDKKIVSLGGDGTVREIASALIGTDIPLGIIPCGTGNDIPRPLGIPSDPIQALDIVLGGTARHMDAAMANDELYFNVAGFGFDVDVLDYVEIYKKKMKNGSLAYMRGLFAAVTRLKNRKTTITWPGGSAEMNVLLIAAGNGTHFGGGMKVTPLADPFDGLLDFCVIHDATKLTLFTLFAGFRSGKHLKTKYVTYFRSTELTAVCDPPSRLDVDGDVLPGTPVTFRILPKSVWVVVPQ
mgnify:CR=1 FL=1